MLWIYLASALGGMGLLLWVPTRFRYQITPRHMRVTLFGLPVRRVQLSRIDRVTTHHVRWAEHWWNTWRPFRRRLMICRRGVWPKNMVITPKYRYEFKLELERAIQRAKSQHEMPAASDPQLIHVRHDKKQVELSLHARNS